MSIQSGVGFSEHRNPAEATSQVVAQAREQLGTGQVDFAIVLVTVGHRLERILDEVGARLGEVPFIGCTVEGIISHRGVTEGTHGLAIALFRSDRLKFVPFGVPGLKSSAENVGLAVGEHVAPHVAQGAAQGLLVLPDGLAFNFDAFTRGLFAKVPSSLPLFGGMAGDNWRFAETRQFHGNEVFTDGVVGALLVGDAQLEMAVSHGCAPLGTERVVTKSEGNVIHEIDGKPALDEIKRYLGFDLHEDDWARGMTELAVGLRTEEREDNDEAFTIRFFPVIDEGNGTVTIPTEIQPGARFWVMRRDVDKMRGGIDGMLGKLQEGLQAQAPAFVLHFDCAGRGKVFLSDAEKVELLERLRAGVPGDAPWIGMFSYGELAPVHAVNHYHSYTAAVIAVR